MLIDAALIAVHVGLLVWIYIVLQQVRNDYAQHVYYRNNTFADFLHLGFMMVCFCVTAITLIIRIGEVIWTK